MRTKLDALHRARVKDFYSQDGRFLYEDILEEIGTVMERIHTAAFRPANCNLFSHSRFFWLSDFKNNFHKLFIDRERFNGMLPYNYFNDDSSGNRCYAEGFALGFLAMLLKAEAMLKEGKKTLSAQDFIQTYIALNALVTCEKEGENRSRLAIRSGNRVQYLPALERVAEGSKVLYQFSNSEIRTIFAAGFDHEKRALEFYAEFHKSLESGAEADVALCSFVNDLASHSHLCLDGNNRSAILCGWLLAITHNISFPVLFNQFCVSPPSIAEGREWTKKFMANPDVSAMTAESFAVSARVKRQNMDDLKQHDPTAFFLYKLLGNYEAGFNLCISLPLNYDKVIAIVGGKVFPGSWKLVDEKWSEVFLPKMTPKDKVFSARFLHEAVEEVLGQLDGCEDKDKVIAAAYMKKIAANLDKLTIDDRTLCEMVIANFQLSDQEFRGNVVRYNQAFPKQEICTAQAKALSISPTQQLR